MLLHPTAQYGILLLVYGQLHLIAYSRKSNHFGSPLKGILTTSNVEVELIRKNHGPSQCKDGLSRYGYLRYEITYFYNGNQILVRQHLYIESVPGITMATAAMAHCIAWPSAVMVLALQDTSHTASMQRNHIINEYISVCSKTNSKCKG